MNSDRYVNVGDNVYIDQVGPGAALRRTLARAVVAAVALGVVLNTAYSCYTRTIGNHLRSSCQSNLRQVSLGLMQYEQDYDEKLPPVSIEARHFFAAGNSYGHAYGWADSIMQYTLSTAILQCPTEGHDGQNNPATAGYTDYWFNRNLSGVDTSHLDNALGTLMLGDGNDGSDTTDARYSYSALPHSWVNNSTKPAHRHLGGANYAFADGHVIWLNRFDHIMQPNPLDSFKVSSK